MSIRQKPASAAPWEGFQLRKAAYVATGDALASGDGRQGIGDGPQAAHPSIPDFPKPGILFYDISTLLAIRSLAHDRRTPAEHCSRPARSPDRHRISRVSCCGPARLSLCRGFAMVARRANCPRTVHFTMISNTGPTRSRSRRMPSPPDTRGGGRRSGGSGERCRRIELVRCRAGSGRRRLYSSSSISCGPQRIDVPFTSMVAYDANVADPVPVEAAADHRIERIPPPGGVRSRQRRSVNCRPRRNMGDQAQIRHRREDASMRWRGSQAAFEKVTMSGAPA